jgi:hypothetical protein
MKRLQSSSAREFLLQHRDFKDRCDHPRRLLSIELPRAGSIYLRVLDQFRAVGSTWDDGMSDPIAVVISKRRSDGR